VFLALDPVRLSGGAFSDRMADLLATMATEPGVRLPGSRRLERRESASQDGVQVPAALVDEIRRIASSDS
jgi:(2R)-3-sulfolactate dehydrogenase (NADP+)